MTKRNLLLVSLFLVFGLATMATTALANMQWLTASSAVLPARAEGLAEETGIYTLTNNVAGTVQAGNYFTVTYNQPIVLGSAFLQCTGGDFLPAGAPYSCTGVGGVFVVTSANVGSPLHGVVTIKFAGPPSTLYTFLVTSDLLALTVRVNASAMATTCPTPPAPLTAYATATTVTTVPPTAYGISITGTNANNTYPLLQVMCSPNLSLTFAAKDKKVDGANGIAGQVLSCIGTKDLGPYDNSFCINVDEEFPNALTSFSYEAASDPDATNGTTFTITLTGVPQNLKIGSPTVTGCGDFDRHDPNYCKEGSWADHVYTPIYEPTLSVTAGDFTCGNDPDSSPPTQTCTITFTVDTEDAGNAENMDICFTYRSRGPLPTGYDEIYANVAKGPTSPSTAIPLFNGTSELKAPGLSVVDFSDCMTTLLYPYVANGAGWDTGMEVSNTTLDPFNTPKPPNPLDLQPTFGKGSAVPQNGPCTFYLFANGAFSPTQPWVAYHTTDTIKAGDIRAFGMQEAFGSAGVNVSGYVIAVCDFQNAHGDAMFTYHLFGNDGVAGNYLCDVLPNPALYHRTPAGNMLGETAIAPYLINKQIQKLLNFGSTSCCGGLF